MSGYEIILLSVAFVVGFLVCLVMWAIVESKNSAHRHAAREAATKELNNVNSLLVEARKVAKGYLEQRDAAHAEIKALKAALPKPKRKAKAKAKA